MSGFIGDDTVAAPAVGPLSMATGRVTDTLPPAGGGYSAPHTTTQRPTGTLASALAAPNLGASMGNMVAEIQRIWKIMAEQDIPKYPDLARLNWAFHVLRETYYTTVCLTAGDDSRTFVMPIILEGTNDHPSPVELRNRYSPVTRKPVVVRRCVVDAAGDDLRQMILNQLAPFYNGRNIDVIEPNVVPRNVAATSESEIRNYLAASVNALSVTLDITRAGYKATNLAAYAGNQPLVLKVNYVGDVRLSSEGIPQRVDFSISLMQEARNDQGNAPQLSLHAGAQGQAELVGVEGFFEFYWVAQPSSKDAKDNWLGVMNLTNARYLGVRTPGAMMLAAGLMPQIASPKHWGAIMAANQNPDEASADPRNLGLLNLAVDYNNNGFDKAGYAELIDTKSTQGRDNLLKFLSTVCRETPLVAVHCPQTGPDAWAWAPFVAAAVGKNGHAAQMLFNHANDMLGGALKTLDPSWAGNMFLADTREVDVGYVTSRGREIPTTVIDTLAVLQAASTTPGQAGMEAFWTALQSDGSMANEERRAGVYEIQTQILGQEPTIKNRAHVVYFNGAMLSNLAQAVQNVFRMRVEHTQTLSSQRMLYGFGNAGAGATMAPRTGWAPQTPQNSPSSASWVTTRWGA